MLCASLCLFPIYKNRVMTLPTLEAASRFTAVTHQGCLKRLSAQPAQAGTSANQFPTLPRLQPQTHSWQLTSTGWHPQNAPLLSGTQQAQPNRQQHITHLFRTRCFLTQPHLQVSKLHCRDGPGLPGFLGEGRWKGALHYQAVQWGRVLKAGRMGTRQWQLPVHKGPQGSKSRKV